MRKQAHTCHYYLLIHSNLASKSKKFLFMNLAPGSERLLEGRAQMASLKESLQGGAAAACICRGPGPHLFGHQIMRKKSGTCHISIRPWKTAGIYGGHLWPLGRNDHILVFASQKKRSPKSWNKSSARPSPSEDDWRAWMTLLLWLAKV